jgi:hypothetical protein
MEYMYNYKQGQNSASHTGHPQEHMEHLERNFTTAQLS